MHSLTHGPNSDTLSIPHRNSNHPRTTTTTDSDQSTLYEAAAPELYAQLEEASGRWADLEIELGVKEAALEASEARLSQLIAANSNLNQTLNSVRGCDGESSQSACANFNQCDRNSIFILAA